MNPNAMDIAWAAGLFEGEGCLTGSRGKSDIHLAVVMADEDVVRRFGRIAGVGSVRLESEARGPHKPLWRWQADGEKAELVVAMLLPLLGMRRRQRALELIAKRAEWRERVTRERACEFCRQIFRPKRAHAQADRQRFCSRQCRSRANDASYRLRRRAAA